MISQDLKRLSRRELVDIIYQLKTREQELLKEIESLKTQLEDKRIRLSAAGSIADAAMYITNIFSVTQTAADLYLQEISSMKEETEKECANKIEWAEQKAKEIFAENKKKAEDLKAAYERDYEKCQELQKQIAELEQKKKLKLCEDILNGI